MSDIFRSKIEEITRKIGIDPGRKWNLSLDTVNYSWVKDYLRDRTLRLEIEDLREQIDRVRKGPIDKGELRNLFTKGLRSIRDARLTYLTERLKQAQVYAAQVPAIGATAGLISNPAVGPLFLDFGLTEEEIDSLFIDLPEGTTASEKEEEIHGSIVPRIREIEEIIKTELCPRDRWFYNAEGIPFPYPQGCRWTAFVSIWEAVVARYEAPVNLLGSKLETEAEFYAYGALELDTIHKITPLRKADS